MTCNKPFRFLLIFFLCPVGINIAFGQAPKISYVTPQTYTANTAIAPLTPKNTGGAVPPAHYAQVITFAGSGVTGYADGTGKAASFSAPIGLTIDANNNIYVADYNNNTIRKITPAGVVTTLAGQPGLHGYADGAGATALFTEPDGVAADNNGNIYVADSYNDLIRLVTPNGTVSTFAGTLQVSGAVNGPTGVATFNSPAGLAIDNKGNLYIADKNNNMIRKINPAGLVSTLAGNLSPGSANGTGPAASFYQPESIAVDAAGNVYVADSGNNLVRKITPAGVVTTLAGSGSAGSADGTGNAASFNNPYGIAIDNTGTIYVADEKNNLIRKITGNGVVTTVAGNGGGNSKDGIGNTASFGYPGSIVADASGYIYVGDLSTFLIRKIGLTGYTIDKPLPTGLIFDGTTGIISGTPTAALPATNYTITAYNAAGDNSTVVNISVIANNANGSLPPNISYQSPQIYTPNATIATLSPKNTGGTVPTTIYGQVSTFAGSGGQGSANGPGNTATFYEPVGTAVDPAGNVYVSDQANYLIRKITPAGVVSTFAGTGSFGRTNGNGVNASFNATATMVTDATGNLYIADGLNNVIRVITPSGQVSTFAGSGVGGMANGTKTTASFGQPFGIAFDKTGDMYVADEFYNQIRQISSNGTVTTLAGSGAAGSANGVGVAASFNGPCGVAVDAAGNVYVADSNNNEIRKITPAGVVSVFAGSGAAGAQNGMGAFASFYYPTGLAIDRSGNLYVADNGNSLVRIISPSGNVSTLAGNGLGFVDGVGIAAKFYGCVGLSCSTNGSIFVADESNNAIREITVTGYTIDKKLPPGLVFDPKTGQISGTPTATSPATNYTVTAYNAGGSSSTVVNLTVKNGNAILPAPPNISYQTPQTYYVNKPITLLAPANTGGAVPPVIYGLVSTVAGNLSTGKTNGTGNAASFGQPVGIVCDAAGNIYVSESINNDIRKVTPAGVVSTFAGDGTQGGLNGSANTASFNSPNQLAADASGNIYVADETNQMIRKISAAGLVSTFAGSGIVGTTDGPAASATFNGPIGITFDALGNLYVADRGNNTIRKITPTGQVTTFATVGSGSPPPNDVSGLYYLATDPSSNLYFVNSDQVQKSTPSASLGILAGTGTTGFLDGSGNIANFDGLVGIAVSPAGIIYVGDVINNRIRQVNPSGFVSTLAGNGGHGSNDGLSATASLNHPCGVTIDPTGSFLYVADKDNNLIRKINITGYSIDRSLPNGLVFDPATGKITGTPSAVTPSQDYTITAYNAGGISSAVVNIQVLDETVVFNAIPTKIVCDADFDPGATGNGPITYNSSDLSVATIISGKIHITGAGTSVITASDGTSQVSQTLTVTAASTPTVTISPATADDCQRNEISFAATVTSGGTNPVYQWQVNGQNAGTNNSQFTADNLNNGDMVTCTITSNASCVTSNTATSNTATFTLDQPINTSVKITSSETGPVCKGTPVTFTAIAFSPDVNPNYQWQVNGVDEGSNQSTFTSSALNESDVVTCVLTSMGKCLVNAVVTSNAITINLNLQSNCVVNVPNTFTPNGDGINDLWDITALQAYPGCTVSIFSRAGALVYNSINYPKAWDGTYNGKKLPEGTYYYVIDLKNGKKPLSGPVTILR